MMKKRLIVLRYSVCSAKYYIIGTVCILLGLAICCVGSAQIVQEKRQDAAAAARKVEQDPLLRKLGGDDVNSVREAAEALEKSRPQGREALEAATEAVKSALGTTKDANAERALRLALGKLAAAGVQDTPDWALDTVEWGFESMSVTHRPTTPPEVFEAHVRALEMVPGAAKELMLGNLDVAINFPDVEPMERERLKEFVTLTAEGMRTKEAAVFLDALLTGDDDFFVELSPPMRARLIACYKNVKAEQPINADAVAQWLEKHRDWSSDVGLAALEAVSVVGTTKKDAAGALADKLLTKLENAEEIGRRIIAGKIDRSVLPQFRKAFDRFSRTGSSAELRRVAKELGIE
jgi:hypothetical protein